MSRSPSAPDVSRCTRAPRRRPCELIADEARVTPAPKRCSKCSQSLPLEGRELSRPFPPNRPRPGASRGSARSKRRRCSRSARPTQQCSTPTVGAPAVAKGPRAAVSPALPARGPGPIDATCSGRDATVSVLRGRLHRRARTCAGRHSSPPLRSTLPHRAGVGNAGIRPRGQGSICPHPASIGTRRAARQARRRWSSAHPTLGDSRSAPASTAPLLPRTCTARAETSHAGRAGRATARRERSMPLARKPGIQARAKLGYQVLQRLEAGEVADAAADPCVREEPATTRTVDCCSCAADAARARHSCRFVGRRRSY